jgi:hypothetical protein
MHFSSLPRLSKLCKFYSPRRYPYFEVVVGLVWSHDPKSYVAVAYATGRASHARQVKGDDPDKRDTVVLQVGGLSWG